MYPLIETWDEMAMRHKRERIELVQCLSQAGYTQTQAAKILDMKLTSLNNFIIRNKINWLTFNQGSKSHLTRNKSKGRKNAVRHEASKKKCMHCENNAVIIKENEFLFCAECYIERHLRNVRINAKRSGTFKTSQKAGRTLSRPVFAQRHEAS